ASDEPRVVRLDLSEMLPHRASGRPRVVALDRRQDAAVAGVLAQPERLERLSRLLEAGQNVEVEVLGRSQHEREHLVVGRLGHAEHVEGLDRRADGRSANAEALGKLSLRRQTIAGTDSAGGDEGLDLGDHRFGNGRRLAEARETDAVHVNRSSDQPRAYKPGRAGVKSPTSTMR